MIWAYVDGGADDQVTLSDNRAAFSRWALRPRVLCGKKTRHLGVTIEGKLLSIPVLIAPTGSNGLANWRGDVAVARAAERRGTRLLLSTASSYSLEEVAEATSADHWFQLYPWVDRNLMKSLIVRGLNAGYAALVVTADVPVLGNREAERQRGMGLPPVLTPYRVLDAARHPRWAYGFLRHKRVAMRNLVDRNEVVAGVESAALHQRLLLSELAWDDFGWIRQQWPGPLYIKGLLDPDDAERAVEIGADGIVVSNHGGRQLDSAPASLDVLAEIAARVGGRATILIDGGIRRGTDIVKAMCLGADACLIGRAMIYGLAARGEDGVADVLRILEEEIDRTLALMGCGAVTELDSSWLIRRSS
jgi:L-lactate dehydrogenase (cytochrome)/(S)-mandelate dehydrogenase